MNDNKFVDFPLNSGQNPFLAVTDHFRTCIIKTFNFITTYIATKDFALLHQSPLGC